MSKVTIITKGLAIKNPDTNELELDFLYQEGTIPHKLKIEIKRGGQADPIINVAPNSRISVVTNKAKPVLHNLPDEVLKILNLNDLHSKKLSRFLSHPDMQLINLTINGAVPYTAKPTDPYQLYATSGSQAPSRVGAPARYTHQIGVEFELSQGGFVEIKGIPDANGNPIKRFDYETNTNYEICFDNDCNIPFHNDFYLYYKVLDGENLRISVEINKLKKLIDKYGKDHEKVVSSLEIACNPVEGGGGS